MSVSPPLSMSAPRSSFPEVRVGVSPAFARAAQDGLLIMVEFIREVSGKTPVLYGLDRETDIALISILDLNRFERKRFRRGARKGTDNLRRHVEQISNSNVSLVMSFENLQHPAWAEFAPQLLNSQIPRTTFFPAGVDPTGARLPYWWNYLDWPQFPRPITSYQRYGRLYSLEKLLAPIPKSRRRLDKACWIGSYINEPRRSLLRHAESTFGLDVFGAVGAPVGGPKVEVLEKYRFAVGAENSLGIGYDSEKIPEAWDAGCIPVSSFIQPLSDFNPLALNLSNPEDSTRHPLLLKEPNPAPVLDYLKRILD